MLSGFATSPCEGWAVDLKTLQKEIATALHANEPSLDLSHLIEGGNRSPESCLQVHRQTWLAGRLKVLRQAFPVIAAIVGQDCFHQLCLDYAESTASYSPDLDQYPAAFPSWLDDNLQQYDSLSEYAYLPDLARLEWAVYACQFARDNQGFDFQSLAALTSTEQARCRFKLADCVRLLSSRHGIHAVWLAHQPDAAGKIPDATGPDYLIIYRRAMQPAIKRLADSETFFMIQQIGNGLQLEALQRLAEHRAYPLHELLPWLLNEGFVDGFSRPDRT
jgi:hypothetical protein